MGGHSVVSFSRFSFILSFSYIQGGEGWGAPVRYLGRTYCAVLCCTYTTPVKSKVAKRKKKKKKTFRKKWRTSRFKKLLESGDISHCRFSSKPRGCLPSLQLPTPPPHVDFRGFGNAYW